LKNILRGESAAASNAIAAAKDNFVDGSPLVLDPNNDIKLVIWNYSNHTYKITTDPDKANGVQILAQRTQERGEPNPAGVRAAAGDEQLRHPRQRHRDGG
jgi:hypothetical protein